MVETFTHIDLNRVIDRLINDRNRLGDYELEDLSYPEDERSFVGCADAISEVINDFMVLTEQENSLVGALEKAFERLVMRCQIATESLASAHANGGEMLAEKQNFYAQRAAAIKAKNYCLPFLPDGTKEKLTDLFQAGARFA